MREHVSHAHNNGLQFFWERDMKTVLLDLNNNSLKFFIIYMPSQHIYGQLQTQHSVDIGHYVMEQYNIEAKTNYKQTLEKIRINTET
jgi:hypothetical protein